jgi:hypothetical protein
VSALFFSNLADPCLRYDCYGGTCTNERGVPRCICPTGRMGSRCQGDRTHALEPGERSLTCSFSLLSLKTIFVPCIHVPTTVNVYQKEEVDAVSAYIPTTATNVETVKATSTFVHGPRQRFHLVYRPNPCDNVHCNQGQCRDGLCECHSGYTGAFCDVPRKCF